MSPKLARYEYLDALRGFAAFWVVLYHLWNRFYHGLSTQGRSLEAGLPADLLTTFTLFTFGFGYTGVTLFFVLSGLCIHLPQARSGVYWVAPAPFAARRFWRLYPAYLASLVFSALALAAPKMLLAASGRSFDWWVESRAHDVLVSAAFLQQFWPESLGFNGVYWTLVYEVQFYIAYPVLLWCLRRVGPIPVGIALLALEIYFAFAPTRIPCFFLMKYFEWFLGVIAAEIITRREKQGRSAIAFLCAILGVGFGVYSVFNPFLYPLRDLLLAVGYFGLILLVAENRFRLATVGRWRPLVGLGLISYSLYLIHVPIIDLVWVGLHKLAASRGLNASVAQWLSFVAVPLCVTVAFFFYRMFERPFFPRKPSSARAESPPLLSEKAAP